MNNLKQKPVMAEILSGAMFLGLLAVSFWERIDHYFVGDTAQTLGNAGIFLLFSWLIGTFFDAVRNGIIENICDKWSKINWDFFFKATKDKVAQFEEYYYSYYQLDMDLSIAIFFFFVFSFLLHSHWCSKYSNRDAWVMISAFLAGVIFIRDARDLRKEIRRLLETTT